MAISLSTEVERAHVELDAYLSSNGKECWCLFWTLMILAQEDTPTSLDDRIAEAFYDHENVHLNLQHAADVLRAARLRGPVPTVRFFHSVQQASSNMRPPVHTFDAFRDATELRYINASSEGTDVMNGIHQGIGIVRWAMGSRRSHVPSWPEPLPVPGLVR